jgi:secreted PhoX family phosphatase
MDHDRRGFLRFGALAAVGMGAGFPNFAEASSAAGESRGYGPLGAPDVNGVRLPSGFSARIVAVADRLVFGTGYVWHGEPDGSATFPAEEGGWIYVSNAELNGTRGGAGAIRFDANGNAVDAYRILDGTKWNCTGGATPWRTWLSCEEFRNGLVWECDPYVPGQGVPRPALGVFAHEASPVDPATGYVYMTEDVGDGRLYRFRPAKFGDLSAGVLEAASVGADGFVRWIEVSDKRPARHPETTAFDRGEGAWISRGVLYFTTTSDDRVWALDLVTQRLEVLYDAAVLGAGGILTSPDNLTVHEPTGDLFVGEDGADLELVQLYRNGTGVGVAPFLQLVGHDGSEVTGPSFTPDGTRLYVTSQRGFDGAGIVFEVTGPFRRR